MTAGHQSCVRQIGSSEGVSIAACASSLNQNSLLILGSVAPGRQGI